MIRWWRVFMTLVVSAWAHGLAAALFHYVGSHALCVFCGSVASLCLVALLPVAFAASEQENDYMRDRAFKAEREVARLRDELIEKDPP